MDWILVLALSPIWGPFAIMLAMQIEIRELKAKLG